MVHHLDAVRRLGRWLADPPGTLRRGPFRPDAFPSARRSRRLTSMIGVILGAAFGVCFLTGVLSHLIQHPPGWFWWPSRPVGLYRVTQGVHVATGLAAIPLLGVKLWSVYPRLFGWPPVRDPAHAIDRLGVAVLVAASLFQLVSGVLNVARWYPPMPFFFTAAHYWVAWLAIGGLLAHIGAKLPVIRDALHRRPGDAGATSRNDPEPAADEPGTDRQPTPNSTETGRRTVPNRAAASRRAKPGPTRPSRHTMPSQTGPSGHTMPSQTGPSGHTMPSQTGLSRRAVLGATGAAAGVVTLATVGQTVAPLAPVSLLAPRRPTTGPQRLPVNKTAATAGIRDAALSPDYRLALAGPAGTRSLSLTALQALPQHTVVLPITCVEGWSATATWTGVRLRDLAALVSAEPAEVTVESLEAGGRYRTSAVAGPHLRDPLTLIALRLNDEPLALDHGYPARLIAPNRPGVLQTKWVARIAVRGAA